jgi:hypothetical protein
VLGVLLIAVIGECMQFVLLGDEVDPNCAACGHCCRCACDADANCAIFSAAFCTMWRTTAWASARSFESTGSCAQAVWSPPALATVGVRENASLQCSTLPRSAGW